VIGECKNELVATRSGGSGQERSMKAGCFVRAFGERERNKNWILLAQANQSGLASAALKEFNTEHRMREKGQRRESSMIGKLKIVSSWGGDTNLSKKEEN